LPPRLGEKYGPDATLTIFQTVSERLYEKWSSGGDPVL
jgi:hypothetical protein